MSPQLLSRSKTGRRGTDEQTDPDAVLAALNDPDCRRIIEATAADDLTAQEIAAACDLPRSTAYRKVEQLADASLLESNIRIDRAGNHPTEYTCAVDHVAVRLADGGSVEVDFGASEDEREVRA